MKVGKRLTVVVLAFLASAWANLSLAALERPCNVVASTNRTDAIKISWDQVEGATGYKVVRSGAMSSQTGEYVISVRTNAVLDTTVDAGARIPYRVVATNVTETSAFSSYVIGFREVDVSFGAVTNVNFISRAEAQASVEVKCNVDWRASSPDDWIYVDDTYGKGNGTINFAVGENTSGAARRGSIVVDVVGGKKVVCNVIQGSAAPVADEMGLFADGTTWGTNVKSQTTRESAFVRVADAEGSFGDVVSSGPISKGESAVVELTVKGPGRLSFRWRKKSSAAGDVFMFGVGSATTATATCSGTNWEDYSQAFTDGSAATMRKFYWVFKKKEGCSGLTVGAGLLDSVCWEGDIVAVEITDMPPYAACGEVLGIRCVATDAMGMRRYVHPQWRLSDSVGGAYEVGGCYYYGIETGEGDYDRVVSVAERTKDINRAGFYGKYVCAAVTNFAGEWLTTDCQMLYVNPFVERALEPLRGFSTIWNLRDSVQFGGENPFVGSWRYEQESGAVNSDAAVTSQWPVHDWLNVTVEGSGRLTFRAKTACSEGEEVMGLVVSVDGGEPVHVLRGVTDWDEYSIDIDEPGEHVVEWAFGCEGDYGSEGRAWLDTVAWEASEPAPTNVKATVDAYPGVIAVSWEHVDAFETLVEYRRAGTADVMFYGPVYGDYCQLRVPDAGDYDVRVRAISFTDVLGTPSDWVLGRALPSFETDMPARIFSSEGGMATNQVGGVALWVASVEEACPWLTFSASSDADDGRLVLVAEPNMTGEARSVRITLKDDSGISLDMLVVQTSGLDTSISDLTIKGPPVVYGGESRQYTCSFNCDGQTYENVLASWTIDYAWMEESADEAPLYAVTPLGTLSVSTNIVASQFVYLVATLNGATATRTVRASEPIGQILGVPDWDLSTNYEDYLWYGVTVGSSYEGTFTGVKGETGLGVTLEGPGVLTMEGWSEYSHTDIGTIVSGTLTFSYYDGYWQTPLEWKNGDRGTKSWSIGAGMHNVAWNVSGSAALCSLVWTPTALGSIEVIGGNQQPTGFSQSYQLKARYANGEEQLIPADEWELVVEDSALAQHLTTETLSYGERVVVTADEETPNGSTARLVARGTLRNERFAVTNAISFVRFTLNDAVDCSSVQLYSHGNGWFPQRDDYTTDGDAARSSALNIYESWMKGHVIGPCTVKFDWKTTAGNYGGGFSFVVDDETRLVVVPNDETAGSWHRDQSFSIPEGLHQLKWVYTNPDRDRGAWVDNVRLVEGADCPSVRTVRVEGPDCLLSSGDFFVSYELSDGTSGMIDHVIDWKIEGNDGLPVEDVLFWSSFVSGSDELTSSYLWVDRSSGMELVGGSITITARVAIGETIRSVSRTIDLVPYCSPIAAVLDSGKAGFLDEQMYSYWDGVFDFSTAGESCAQSTMHEHKGSAPMMFGVYGPGTFEFDWKVSSEQNFDRLSVAVDGVKKAEISGERDWAHLRLTVTEDASLEYSDWHYVEFIYEKDGSVSFGSDCGWVDNVKWAGSKLPPVEFGDPFGPEVIAAGSSGVYNVAFWREGGRTQVVLGGEDDAPEVEWSVSFDNPSTAAYVKQSRGEGGQLVLEVDPSLPADDIAKIRFSYVVNDYEEGWDFETAVLRSCPLPQAVDNEKLILEARGAGTWFGQFTDSSFGSSSARCANMAQGQKSELATALVGSGTLSFDWQFNWNEYYGRLTLFVDGVALTNMSSQSYEPGGWYSVAVALEEGTHEVSWAFEREVYGKQTPEEDTWSDFSIREGGVYLDNIQWTGKGYAAPAEAPVGPVATETSKGVPFAWLEATGVAAGSDAWETAEQALAANGVNTLWECYVAGLDPVDPLASFKTFITITNDVPYISWQPDLRPARTYIIKGKESLADPEWVAPTNSLHRFFKVEIEWNK